MSLTTEMCAFIRQTASSFPTGAPRRRYMAKTLETFNLSQREAQQRFGWSRNTLRKALQESRTGITCLDAFTLRGRKPAEFHFPRLLDDIKQVLARGPEKNIRGLRDTIVEFVASQRYEEFAAEVERAGNL